MKKKLLCFLCLLFSGLTGCIGRRLDVQTTFLTQESLASTIISTPDPALLKPPIGQRLIVQWNLRREFTEYQFLSFHLKMRFRNQKELTICKHLKNKQGTYIYEVLNDAYLETKGGILTYRLDVYADGELIDMWQHPLWAQLIRFEPPQLEGPSILRGSTN